MYASSKKTVVAVDRKTVRVFIKGIGVSVITVKAGVLTALYSAKPPCLSAHLPRWIFYPQPPLRCRKSALRMSEYSAEFRQI
ncbi:MAG: hypothetical protein HFI69_07980 [Lachnospiraceae bacterium]|nr:hypothetical protein [Lachnospiraceae bacterium]